MEVSIVLESNDKVKEDYKVHPLSNIGEAAKDSFLTIKIYEYFKSKISSKGYSKEATNSIMKRIEECIPKENLCSFFTFDQLNIRLDILIKEISMKAESRGISIDEKDLKDYLIQVYNENKNWIK